MTATATAQTTPSLATIATVERQLKTASILSGIFALFFSFASHDATDAPVRWFSDILFWRLDEGVAQLTNTNHLADAILGGVMCGWSAMMWLLADRFLAQAPADTKSIFLISAAVWFVTDSAGSIASGAWLNAFANVGFLAMFVLPLRKI